jgi:hypothetical protein
MDQVAFLDSRIPQGQFVGVEFFSMHAYPFGEKNLARDRNFQGRLLFPFSISPSSPLAQQNQKPRLEMIPPEGIFKLLRFPRLLEKGAKISLDGKAGLHHPMLHFLQ